MEDAQVETLGSCLAQRRQKPQAASQSRSAIGAHFMAAFLGISNAVWMAVVIGTKLEPWGVPLTAAAALTPLVIIGLGCLAAHLYDETHSNPQR